MSLNVTVLQGRLVADPEATDANGTPLTKFTVAVQRIGKQKDVADFFDIVTWGKTAEYVAAYQTKGRRVEVVGRLEQQRWENSEGQKRSRIVVVANQVNGLDWEAPTDGEPVAAAASKGEDTSDIPF
jgi:single-strand DNA-binding protein